MNFERDPFGWEASSGPLHGYGHSRHAAVVRLVANAKDEALRDALTWLREAQQEMALAEGRDIDYRNGLDRAFRVVMAAVGVVE